MAASGNIRSGVLAAMAAAEARGDAAVIYEGDMVDYAMVATARELIALAESIEAAGGRPV
mgnify:CR=1 FL=1